MSENVVPSLLRHRALTVAALIGLAALPYLQTLSHDFVNYDDNFYVTENPHVQPGLKWHGVTWAFTTFKGGNWHPLTWLSHMLDETIWGNHAGGHHFTSVVLHAANTLLVFAIFIRMTGDRWRSLLVAALFAVHPLHVESVAWIAERKDVLSALFGLVALLSYLGYVRRPSPRRYLLMVCFFVLSLMAKPMLVTLPFVLLLLDIWPLRRWRPWTIESDEFVAPAFDSEPARRILLEKIPLLFVAAIFSVIAIVSQHAAGTVASLQIYSLSTRAINAVVGYRLYIDKLITPIKLAVFYPHPDHWRLIDVISSAVVLIVISWVAIVTRRRYPWLIIGWLWFVGTLIPVIGLVQIGMQSIADRYSYIPAVGIFMMAAWSIPHVCLRLAQRAWVVAACSVIIVLTMITWLQVSYWQNSRTLFTHALDVTQGNFIAHQNLGSVLELEGNLNGALEHYEQAARDYPRYGRIYENIGNIFVKQGRYSEALTTLNKAIELDPDSSAAFNSIGSVALINNRYDDAAKNLKRAVQLDPDNVPAHINYGSALVKLERYDEAIAQLAPVTRAEPRRIVARTNLAYAFAGRGNVDQAIAELRQILQIAPDYEPAQDALRKFETERK